MHIASKVWNFIKTRRKLSLAAFVIILAVVGISSFIIFSHVGVSTAHAQAVTPAPAAAAPAAPAKPATAAPAVAVPTRTLTDQIVGYIASILLFVAQFFIQITIFILRFVIEVGAYNGYIDSTAVNYGWIMVRDVTNMFFVIILLVIAFGTILGLEQYEYKKLLFKMIAAAVIVNFSRTICGLIIDFAQVIMVTFINGVAATAGGNLINMFSMQDSFKFATATGAKDFTGKNVFLASLAALIFSAMAMATMFVFLIMLLARLVTLWILIVLSPLAFVLNVIPQTQKYASQWWTEFGNNVISGPIIAFFLWLAFVTAGSGNANDDIVSGLPNSNLKVDAGAVQSVGDTAAGVSKAMSWTSMASMAIAIGMLLVGAKMAQQLGVAGGAMMGKAVDFGKRVATVASGISAARWAGRRGLAAGKAAGKFVAMKAPIVGGEAWQRRGRGIAGRASLAYGKLEEYRNVKAKEWEEKKGWRGALGKVGAGLIESRGRKMKRATDWQEAAKLQKKNVDEMLGVGGAAGGIEKTRAAIRLENAELLGKEVKAAAFEKQRARMAEGGAGMTEEEIAAKVGANAVVQSTKNILDANTAALQKAEENLKAAQESDLDPVGKKIEIADAKKKLNEAQKTKDDSQSQYQKAQNKARAEYKGKAVGEVGTFAERQYALRAKAAVEGKAESELLRVQRERKNEIDVAEAQALKESEKTGYIDTSRVDQVRAKHAKEDRDRENVVNYEKAGLKAANLGDRIGKLGKKEQDKTISPEEAAMLDALRMKLGNYIQSQTARGSLYGVNAQNEALKAMGLSEIPTSADSNEGLVSVQAKMCSSRLGQQVPATEKGVEEGMKVLEKRFGSAYMEQMMDSVADMANQNSVKYAGALRINPADGKVRATKPSVEEDQKVIRSKRIEAKDHLDARSKDYKGVNNSIDEDGKGNGYMSSREAVENFAQMFGGLTRESAQRIPDSNLEHAARALEHTQTKLEDVISALGERGKSNLPGLEAVLTKLAGAVSNNDIKRQLMQNAEIARQQLSVSKQQLRGKK